MGNRTARGEQQTVTAKGEQLVAENRQDYQSLQPLYRCLNWDKSRVFGSHALWHVLPGPKSWVPNDLDIAIGEKTERDLWREAERLHKCVQEKAQVGALSKERAEPGLGVVAFDMTVSHKHTLDDKWSAHHHKTTHVQLVGFNVDSRGGLIDAVSRYGHPPCNISFAQHHVHGPRVFAVPLNAMRALHDHHIAVEDLADTLSFPPARKTRYELRGFTFDQNVVTTERPGQEANYVYR